MAIEGDVQKGGHTYASCLGDANIANKADKNVELRWGSHKKAQ